MKKILLLTLTFALSFGLTRLIANPKDNGFNLEKTIIPVDNIFSGGPGRDGIPAIDQPKFINAENADFLRPSDRVLGLAFQDINKAYPIKILNFHEIVNDRFNNEPVVITFCPLCGSGIAYSAMINGQRHSFGVSGLLYNSDVLLYDRETESLWSQLMNQSVSGPLQGEKLTPIALTHTTWEDWKQRFPKTQVLSKNTGFSRNYDTNPYEGYHLDRKIWFPVEQQNDSYHPKELILGIELNGQTKCYAFSELSTMPDTFKDTIAEQAITIRYDKQHKTASIVDLDNQTIPTVITFWFAWYAFHPDTLIFKPE